MIKYLVVLLLPCCILADKPEWVAYVNPMMLGRTFDKSTNQVGVDIISLEDVAKTESTGNSTKEFMKYKYGNSDESKRDLLDVSGSLALKIKGGFISVTGSGQYIKDEGKGDKYYEILTVVQRRTKTISLASNVKADLSNVGKIIGKHYVSKIQYGANMVASLRYKYNTIEEKQNISATVQLAMQDKSGAESFKLEASANLTKIDAELSKKFNLEIKYYADVQLDSVPQNIEDFKDLVNRFPALVAETTDNGMGRPISVYLQPLEALLNDEKYTFTGNAETNAMLEDIERQVTDLIVAKNLLYSALKDKRTLTDDQETWLDEIYSTILNALKAYRETIALLDLEKDTSQFDAALRAYNMYKPLDVETKRKESTLCSRASKRDDELTVGPPIRYTRIARALICNMEDVKSNSIYDQKVADILSLKTDFMDVLDKRNVFLNNILFLEDNYENRFTKIFQHYFMATRATKQDGIKQGGTVVFNHMQIESPKPHGYDKLTGEFTAPVSGLYLLSQHVSGTNMDMNGDGKGICPITQAHTKSQFKYMNENDKYTVPSDTDSLVGVSTFMGILVDFKKTEDGVECAKRDDFEDTDEDLDEIDDDLDETDHDESGHDEEEENEE
uniref:Toxin candidate TRINITY_DN8015_c0_g1_i1 n=1 Tax=Pachycerianthus borealis TaxID=2736680 RepID=A0A7G7WZ56_9CNID|nr:toxin candidate TRINITY_DN8015_c0_g1_i1 [Pachycerianthus borealis]